MPFRILQPCPALSPGLSELENLEEIQDSMFSHTCTRTPAPLQIPFLDCQAPCPPASPLCQFQHSEAPSQAPSHAEGA